MNSIAAHSSSDYNHLPVDFWEQLTRYAKERSKDYLIEQMSSGVWIYGVGNYGMKIASLLEDKSLPLLGFIDQRADRVKEIRGVPVIDPSAFTPSMADGRCFVLGILNAAVDADDILPLAERFPFRSLLWCADLPEALGSEANNFWLSSRTFLLDNSESIRKAVASLSDQKSVDVYTALLLNRITGRRSDHPDHDLRTQYLPPDLPGFDHPIVFVDGGAYSGDTGMMLQEFGVKLKGWIAFEPDATNFEKLARTSRKSGIPANLFPCGLADHSCQVRFESALGVRSRVCLEDEQGTWIVQCVALDDVIQNVAPDFIKLDVEGAEIAALSGMTRTVTKFRPRLAISGYHRPQDLWEIPLKLLELLPNARLHVRQHGSNGFETVFYALP